MPTGLEPLLEKVGFAIPPALEEAIARALAHIPSPAFEGGLIGAPIGATVGAIKAERGHKLKGAGKGALAGAALGAGGGLATSDLAHMLMNKGILSGRVHPSDLGTLGAGLAAGAGGYLASPKEKPSLLSHPLDYLRSLG